MLQKQLTLRVHSWMMALLLGNSCCFGQAAQAEHPIPEKERKELTNSLTESAEQFSRELLDLYSKRGDTWFFLGEFRKATADYEAMVDLSPQQGDSHWRRGISRFYSGQAKEAAEQFEAYHSFDDIDRENGIWRYLSQYKAYGPTKAKAGLLKYRKTDREPFPDVYRLFSGDTTPEQILENIRTADISDDERGKRLFYAQLYIGLNHSVEGRDADAIRHLRESTANSWGPKAGYGPRYMWHVGRVHLDLLLAGQKQPAASIPPPGKAKATDQPSGGR